MKIINLLPKNKQEEIKYESIYHGMVVLLVISVFSFALVFLTQLAAKFYLKGKISAIEKQIEYSQKQIDNNENAELKKKITAVNEVVADYKGLAENAPKWSKVLKAFSPIPPQGIKVQTFVVDLPAKKINITGFSPTRELVIALYNQLLASKKYFYNVDYPLENVSRPEDINFHFSFNFQEELIK